MSNMVANLLHGLGGLLVVLLVAGVLFYRSRYNQAKSGAERAVKQAQEELKSVQEKIVAADRDAQHAQSKAQHIVVEAQNEAASIIKQARAEGKERILEAKEEILKAKTAAEEEEKQRALEHRDRQREIRNREHRLTSREDSLDKRNASLDKREQELVQKTHALKSEQQRIDELVSEQTQQLERISSMTADEARQTLLDVVKSDVIAESAQIIRESEQRTKATCDRTARKIISLAIQRYAADATSQATITSVSIPSDDLKGRIIGREGRNIRSFEQLTGVNLVIDDTPETVILSSFDPVRREIARVTLESLIADGRIHPARIEEMHKKATDTVNDRIREAGEAATFEIGIHDMDPEIVRVLGCLQYRTSYGQNVLKHSLQVAYICGMMASELGLDPVPARRAGLLHDIGKAIDHEIEGSHAVIGAELARKHGEAPEIVHAIEAHHHDIEPDTVLDNLVIAADAISAARPGARRESAEAYLKRLEKLEEIANAHEGVERTYAMQAGREIRVMVKPEEVNDAKSTVIAHEIAQTIQNEMQYPGQVKVVVIRESRSIEYAK